MIVTAATQTEGATTETVRGDQEIQTATVKGDQETENARASEGLETPAATDDLETPTVNAIPEKTVNRVNLNPPHPPPQQSP